MPRLKGFSTGFSQGFGGPKSKSYLQIITPVLTGTYEDGDILSAVTYRHVRAERAQGLVQAKTLVNGTRQMDRLNTHGLYDAGDVLQDYLEATSKLRYERLNATQGRVTRLSDLNQITFTTNTTFVQHDGKAVQMDLDAYVKRRRATLAGPGGRGRPLFGSPGTEVWYGGSKFQDHTVLDTVWASIESKLLVSEADVADAAVFSDYRKRLVIAVNDMSDEDAGLLTQPQETSEPITVNTVTQVSASTWTLTLSAPASALASQSSARVESGVDQWGIAGVNGSDLLVAGSVTPVPGPMTLVAETAKRGKKVQWRNLRDVVEPDVLDRQKVVRIDSIRKHVRQQVVEAK